MNIPSNINFKADSERKVFSKSTPEYKSLKKINDDGNWSEYINEQLVNNVSVIYDSTGDYFAVKPLGKINSTIKEKQMYQNKKRQLQKESVEETKKKYLLLDDEEVDDSKEPEELDFEDEVPEDLLDISEALPEEEQEVEAEMQAETPSTVGNMSLEELQKLVQDFMGAAQSAPAEEAAVKDDLANGSTVGTFNTDDLDSITNTDFPEIQDEVKRVNSKIDGESYLDVLTGGVGSTEAQSDDLITGVEETEVLEESDEAEGLMEDKDDVRREEPILDAEDPTDGEDDVEVLDADGEEEQEEEENEFDKDDEEEVVTDNCKVMCNGSPIEIKITGIVLTLPEVDELNESVIKSGGKLKKIANVIKDQLILFVESNNYTFKVKFHDVSTNINSQRWSIGEKKFTSLKEAIAYTKKVNDKTVNKYFEKFKNDKNLVNRQMTNLKESDIFDDFRNLKNYIPSCNVKSAGMVNLKTSLNERFSKVIDLNKTPNTLIVDKEGKYYLIKNNLKEHLKNGDKRHFIDYDGKKDYSICKVLGLFENTNEGFKQLATKTGKQQVELLIFK